LTFTIHSFVTQINLYAIQLLQCQNQRKSTYHTKNSRSNIQFQEFPDFSGVGTMKYATDNIKINVYFNQNI